MSLIRRKSIPGIVMLSIIAVFFTLRAGWLRAHFPHDLEQQARGFTRLDIIEKPAVANHAGTAIGLIHTTEYGEGVFIENIEEKTERKLCEVKDASYDPQSTWLFGWSPDDSILAFSWNHSLQLVRSDTGERLGSLAGDMIKSFTWLSTNACAYLSNGGDLVLIKSDGETWKVSRSWPLPTATGAPEQLLATGADTVAWRAKRQVWRMDLSSGEPKLFFTVPGTGIRSYAYSQETHTFLVADLRGAAFRTLMAVPDSEGDLSVKVLPCKHPGINGPQWINHGKGYAYSDDNLGVNGTEPLIIKLTEDAPEKVCFPHGQMLYTFCDDTNIYAVGGQTNEAFGVWRYDYKQDQMTCAWCPNPDPKTELHYQPLLTGHAEMGDKHVESFYLIPPAHFSKSQKYPLAIGFAGYDWSPASQGAATGQVLANCGAYTAYVSYRWPADQPRNEAVYWQTAGNLLAVYNQLSTNPHIDTNCVYIFGYSENTRMVELLADRFPGRWKGVIDLSAIGAFPAAKAGVTDRLTAFSTASDMEPDFCRQQLEMFKIGTPMDWHIYEGAHLPRSKEVLDHEITETAEAIFKK